MGLKEKRLTTLANNFSKKAAAYHDRAIMQRQAAATLIKSLQRQSHPLVKGPILEIGCGTGFVTEQLVKIFPDRQISVTDLSEGMIAFCRQRLLPSSEQLTFYVQNGEQIVEENSYSLIISGMTLQWFQDLDASLEKWTRALKPGGMILFSFLEAGSFWEWHQMCRHLDIPIGGNRLPEAAQVRKILHQLSSKSEIWEESITNQFVSAAHFFRLLKDIGVSTPVNNRALSPFELKRLMQYWDQSHSDGIKVTYRLAFGKLEKK